MPLAPSGVHIPHKAFTLQKHSPLFPCSTRLKYNNQLLTVASAKTRIPIAIWTGFLLLVRTCPTSEIDEPPHKETVPIKRIIPRPQELKQMTLLINSPKLWTAPNSNAPARPTHWIIGRRIAFIEKKSTDEQGAGKPSDWYRINRKGRSEWLPGAYLAPLPQPIGPATSDSIGHQRVTHQHGLHPNYIPHDLIEVGPGFEEYRIYQLRKEPAIALARLIQEAQHNGIRIYVASAYRSWQHQQRTYERRLREDGLEQRTVAKPGHSEHQLGTTVDFTDGDESTLLRQSFGKTHTGRWLRKHAHRFGFALSYTSFNQSKTGYDPEPWHYRYWGNLAPQKHQEALGKSPK